MPLLIHHFFRSRAELLFILLGVSVIVLGGLVPEVSAQQRGAPRAPTNACESQGGRCGLGNCVEGETQQGECEDVLLYIDGPCCIPTDKIQSSGASQGATSGAPQSATSASPGTIGSTTKLDDPLGGLGLVGIISRLIQTFLGMVGALALLVFFYSGVMYMTAGSSDRIKKAIEAMKYAALGLFIIMFAYMISSLFLSVLTEGAVKKATEGPVAVPRSRQ